MKDKVNYPGKSRKHINILLEPHRGELLSEYVRKVDKKRSDVLREIIYSFLCEEYGPEIYSEAVAKDQSEWEQVIQNRTCLLYTSPSPRDATLSRMPSSA